MISHSHGQPVAHFLALIPAHNEAATIDDTLTSLERQGLPPTWTVVVCDNCTDDTAEIAHRRGVRVFTTEGNTDKKAGALNQALAVLLPELEPTDHLLVMDADSVLAADFLETSRDILARNPDVGAVGGVFHGHSGGGLIGALQRNEYARYAREIHRKSGRASVLTGTGSVFRVSVLRDVAAARGGELPGIPGRVYDTLALTEDNEITLAIKTLGWRAVSPRRCRVTTEIMTTWGDLWKQRLRWQRGALENLRNYGVNRVTLPYVAKQVVMYLGIVAIALLLVGTVLFITMGDYGPPRGFWLAVTAVFVVERIVTVRRRGWRATLLAAPLVIEFLYDLFQQAVFVRAAFDAVFTRSTEWHHATDE
ncbi:Glycosyltransferase like family 2 [Prauserella alba]|nr:Glycosyltransferase like family 2 [Prauserella alba]